MSPLPRLHSGRHNLFSTSLTLTSCLHFLASRSSSPPLPHVNLIVSTSYLHFIISTPPPPLPISTSLYFLLSLFPCLHFIISTSSSSFSCLRFVCTSSSPHIYLGLCVLIFVYLSTLVSLPRLDDPICHFFGSTFSFFVFPFYLIPASSFSHSPSPHPHCLLIFFTSSSFAPTRCCPRILILTSACLSSHDHFRVFPFSSLFTDLHILVSHFFAFTFSSPLPGHISSC